MYNLIAIKLRYNNTYTSRSHIFYTQVLIFAPIQGVVGYWYPSAIGVYQYTNTNLAASSSKFPLVFFFLSDRYTFKACVDHSLNVSNVISVASAILYTHRLTTMGKIASLVDSLFLLENPGN